MHRLESGLPESERESSLRYQTRCLRVLPRCDGLCHGLSGGPRSHGVFWTCQRLCRPVSSTMLCCL